MCKECNKPATCERDAIQTADDGQTTPAPVYGAGDAYSNEMAREYGTALKQMAVLDENCAVIDTWECLEGDSQERSQYLQEDGIHINEKGHTKVYEAIMDTVQRLFPHVYPM